MPKPLDGRPVECAPLYLHDFVTDHAAMMSSIPDYAMILPQEFAKLHYLLLEAGRNAGLREHTIFRRVFFEKNSVDDLRNVSSQLLAAYALYENDNLPMSHKNLRRAMRGGFVIPGFEYISSGELNISNGGQKLEGTSNHNGLVEAVLNPSRSYSLYFLGKDYSVPRLKRLSKMFPQKRFRQRARDLLVERIMHYEKKDESPRKGYEANVKILKKAFRAV